MRKITWAALLLASLGASPGDCGGGHGNGQLEEKIQPGNPIDVPFGIYQIVGFQGHAFFQDQILGTEREVYAFEVQRRIATGAPMVIVDVRTVGEFAIAHIPGAVSLPLDVLFTVDSLATLPTDGTPVVVVSGDGHAAAMAAGVLGAMGYPVYVLRFGMIAWKETTDVPVAWPDRKQTIRGLNGALVR